MIYVRSYGLLINANQVPFREGKLVEHPCIVLPHRKFKDILFTVLSKIFRDRDLLMMYFGLSPFYLHLGDTFLRR